MLKAFAVYTFLIFFLVPDSISAQIVKINFDDFSDGWRIEDEYSPQGVYFVNDYVKEGNYRASPIVKAYSSALTFPNVLVNSARGELSSSHEIPLVLYFNKAISGIGIRLGYVGAYAYPPDITATVTMFDCQGNLKGQQTAKPDARFYTSIQIFDPTGTTQLVIVDYGATSIPEAIEDLAFQIGTGSCSDKIPPVIEISSHQNNQIVAEQRIILKGTVKDNSGMISSFKIQGVHVKLTPHADNAGKIYYTFEYPWNLVPGSNQITLLASDLANNKSSVNIVLNYGAPAAISMAEFHLTQRGVMDNKTCDCVDPLVVGKFTIVRIRLDAKTSQGAPTYVNQVELRLYRQDGGTDKLVDTFWGTTYSPLLSIFDSPSQMAGIHFWIEGYQVDVPGKYKMQFKSYLNGSPVGSVLDVPCNDHYFTFEETQPIKLLIQPAEAPLFSPDLGQAHINDVFTQLFTTVRAYPVREGFSEYGTAGLKYDYTSPFIYCNGVDTSEYCDSTGFEWTFKDTHPAGISRAEYESVLDPTTQEVIGGRILNKPLVPKPRSTRFGLFRVLDRKDKYFVPIDDNHDGIIDSTDLINYISQFRNSSGDWITVKKPSDLKNYNQGDVFRDFTDSNNNNKVDPSEAVAPIHQRRRNHDRMGNVATTALDRHNSTYINAEAKRKYVSFWIPLPFHPYDNAFGFWQGGSATPNGIDSWIQVSNHNNFPHELGHNFGFNDEYSADLASIQAWQAYIYYQKVDSSKLISMMYGYSGHPNTRFFTSEQYKTLFSSLKTQSAKASVSLLENIISIPFLTGCNPPPPIPPPGEQDALFLSGLVDPFGRLVFLDTYISTSSEFSKSLPEGAYSLVLGAGKKIYGKYFFQLSYPSCRTVDTEYTSGTFHLIVPVPGEMEWLQILHKDKLLKQINRSAESPSVVLVYPNGGEHFQAQENVRIEWISEDIDSPDLQYSVHYTPDEGKRWYLIAHGLKTTSYTWNTESLPGGSKAFIQVRASDGFNEGVDKSDAFFMVEGKPPVAAIFYPKTGSNYLQGEFIPLQGGVIDMEEGTGITTIWRLNGKVVSDKCNELIGPLAPGKYKAEMEAVDTDGFSTRINTTFNVQTDSDMDGMPDIFEEEYGLEPGLSDDSLWDPDEDGLSSFEESWRSLNPTNPDTDGDGYSDGEEVLKGSNPLDAGSTPIR